MAGIVELNPSIPHEARLKELKEALDKRENRSNSMNMYGLNMYGRICFLRKLLWV